MPKERFVHINMRKDGEEVNMGAETVFEFRKKIGEMALGSDAGVGFALASIKRSAPHWHDATREYYAVISGTGTAHIDGQSVRLIPLDWLEIPLKAVHSVSSRNGIYLLAITSPPWSKDDHHLASEKKK